MADYFLPIHGTKATQRTYLTLLTAYDRALAPPRPNRARAAMIRQIILEFERLHRDLATDVAREATASIRGYIESSRGVGGGGKKRPKRSIASGDMSGNVFSEPLASAIPLGSVGIGRIDVLNKTVNPGWKSAGPYWRAQEYGYDHTGRILPGYFREPGKAAPDAGQFRDHAYFRPAGTVPGQRPRRYTPRSGIPAMQVQKPIRARHFLRDGAREGYREWRERQAAIERRLVTAMRRAAAL